MLVLGWAVVCPTLTYRQFGHENRTKLKHHVAIHISWTICARTMEGTSHHGEQHRRRRESEMRRPLTTEGGRYGADKLPFVRCGPAAELFLAPSIASVGRRAAARLARPDNRACYSSFHVRCGGLRTTVCWWQWCRCQGCCWRRRRCTGRWYALKAQARRVRDCRSRRRRTTGVHQRAQRTTRDSRGGQRTPSS